MDEALKAYTTKRREDAGSPMELHPATRKLLQGEVARVYAKKRSSGASGFMGVLLRFWPRIAAATGTLALVAVAIFGIVPAVREQKQTARLAPAASSRLEKFSEREVLDREKAEMPALKPADELSLAQNNAPKQSDSKRDTAALNESLKSNVRLQSEDKRAYRPREDQSGVSAPAKAPKPVDQPMPLARTEPAAPAVNKPEDALAKKNVEEQRTLSYADAKLKSAPGQVPLDDSAKASTSALLAEQPASNLSQLAAKDASLGRASQTVLNLQETNGSGWYVQTGMQQLGAAAPLFDNYSYGVNLPVLNSFHFEQSSNRVVIRDLDGSVYTGDVITTPQLTGESLKEAEKIQAGKELDGVRRALREPEPQAVFFRAAGTNRSLRKPVTIEASLSSASAQPQSEAATPPPQEPQSRARSSSGGAGAVSPAQRSQSLTQQDSSVRFRQYSTQQPISVIRGRAMIGTNQEFQIQAVPAQR